MKILLIGEASFVHNTLKKALEERGHRVVTMSDGNGWHDAPRDIDLRRNMKYGKFGGLMVLWKLLTHLPQLVGNDVVQIHNYQFVPLKYGWNTLLLKFLKLFNKSCVKLCLGDDPQIFMRQAQGVPRYSDTFWNGSEQNADANKDRIDEVMMPSPFKCWKRTTLMADALVAVLYEYWLCYETEPFSSKLFYCGLPIDISETLSSDHNKSFSSSLKVLVGIQPKRDFMKGAMRIAAFLEDIAARHPGRLKIKYVEGVPYDEYMALLQDADVLVDQLYSFTPSMNSLEAMARGTVVIGGAEEEYYSFIGENTLRPIINVSPELTDEQNIAIIERALLDNTIMERLSKESRLFVKKYHDSRNIAQKYEKIYKNCFNIKL